MVVQPKTFITMAKSNEGAQTQETVVLVAPVQSTVVCEVVAYKEVEASGSLSKDTAFLYVTTLGIDSKTLTVPVNLEFVNKGDFKAVLYVGNVISLQVEKHIAQVTGFIKKGDLDMTAHEKDAEASFVGAVNATMPQKLAALRDFDVESRTMIMQAYGQATAAHNAQLASKGAGSAASTTYGAF